MAGEEGHGEVDVEGAALSDVEGDEDPSPVVIPSEESRSDDAQRIRDLVAELDRERRARKDAEDSRSELQTSFNRLKALAHDVIKKRDEAIRDKDDASRSADRAAADLADATGHLESLRSEADSAAQMLVSGIDKISNKISGLKAFSGLPKSQKYATGLPSVAYGVIKRANEIAEELLKQIEAASQSRDQAREQMEHRNYQIAIEVSQLEAAISDLSKELSARDKQIENLQKLVADSDSTIPQLEARMSELQQSSDEYQTTLKALESKVVERRPLLMEQMNYISKAYGQMQDIIRIVDTSSMDMSTLESHDSLFMWQENDVEENLHTMLEGSKSVYQSAKIASEKVKDSTERNHQETMALSSTIDRLMEEKQHITTLLRSALSSKTNEALQVAEDGLREAGIDLRLNGHSNNSMSDSKEENEVYTLADALDSTFKASQIKVRELQHLVESLRAESSLCKAHLDSQEKEIKKQKHQIMELEEKHRVANENVEGLMMDIVAAEEEIARWKAAAEQEAAAGKAVEQEFLSQLSMLRQELEEIKQTLVGSENKLKFKEETASAALSARDAAEKSLKLADLRCTRYRERIEELTRQLEESDGRATDSRNQNNHRYVCWPWQWLGVNLVRYHTEEQQGSNEMELSEPLL